VTATGWPDPSEATRASNAPTTSSISSGDTGNGAPPFGYDPSEELQAQARMYPGLKFETAVRRTVGLELDSNNRIARRRLDPAS